MEQCQMSEETIKEINTEYKKTLIEEEQKELNKKLMLQIQNEKNSCKHKLKNAEVRWMSPDTGLIQLECVLCKNKFSGLIIKN